MLFSSKRSINILLRLVGDGTMPKRCAQRVRIKELFISDKSYSGHVKLEKN